MKDGDDNREDGDDPRDPPRSAHDLIDSSRVDAEAAIQLVRILLIALIESEHIDAERLREVVDDVISADHDDDGDDDGAFRGHVARRVEEVARASYAVAPAGGADDIFGGFGKPGGDGGGRG